MSRQSGNEALLLRLRAWEREQQDNRHGYGNIAEHSIRALRSMLGVYAISARQIDRHYTRKG